MRGVLTFVIHYIYIYIYMYIYVNVFVCLGVKERERVGQVIWFRFVSFYGLSTSVGYLMPTLVYTYILDINDF